MAIGVVTGFGIIDNTVWGAAPEQEMNELRSLKIRLIVGPGSLQQQN